jgi:hypothetical protein
VVDRVLRGDHEERPIQLVGGSVNRHAAFRHRFEQRRLGAGGGSVDFIGQKNLREDRPRAEFELRMLGVEDRCSRDVAGQQVGRTLSPLEGSPDALGEAPGEHRLGDSRDVFQQHVSPREIGHQDLNEFLPLAQNHTLDVGDQLLGDLVDLSHSVRAFK